MKLLYAEDEKAMSEAVVDILMYHKYIVDAVYDGEEALDYAQGGTAVDNNAAVTVEEGSTWVLTGNCTISTLENNGTIQFNGYTITLADGTVLQ